MAVVGFSELHNHAIDQGYGLAVVNVHTLAIARGVIESATEIDAPLVFTVNAGQLAYEVLPSLEVMALRALNPISLVAKRIQTTEQASLAIRSGCNGLILAQGLSDSTSSDIHNVASSCGIVVIEQEQLSGSLIEVEAELESVSLGAIARTPASWQKLDDVVAQAAASHVRVILVDSGAAGQGRHVLETCKPWRPVEHLIVYNTTTDDAASAELAAEGRRVLDRIPGVRATWSGCSVRADAGYRWCWLIRFAHPAVIDSYRDHPDHVAYADNCFRPVAGDRISIDYAITSADETWP